MIKLICSYKTRRLLNRLHNILSSPATINIKSKREEIRILMQTTLPILDNPTWIGETNRNIFINGEGLDVTMKILAHFKGDDEILEIVLRILAILMAKEEVKKNYVNKVALFMVKRNGLFDSLSELLDMHSNNTEIQSLGRDIINYLKGANLYVALEYFGRIKEAMLLNIPYITLLKIQSKQLTIQDAYTTEEKCATNNDKHSEVPGIEALELIIKTMREYKNQSQVQSQGFEIILKSLNNTMTRTSTQIDYLMKNIDNLSTILTNAIKTFRDDIKVLWRAHMCFCHFNEISSDFNIKFSNVGGCGVVMDNLMYCDNTTLKQCILWTLSSICQEESCRNKLVDEFGLKPYLYDLLYEQKNDFSETACHQGSETIVSCEKVVVPLYLGQLFDREDLRTSKLIVSVDTQSPSYVKEPYILPSKKIDKGSKYGTVKDLFDHGYPGLI